MTPVQREEIRERGEALARAAKRLREAADFLARSAREGYNPEQVLANFADVEDAHYDARRAYDEVVGARLIQEGV